MHRTLSFFFLHLHESSSVTDLVRMAYKHSHVLWGDTFSSHYFDTWLQLFPNTPINTHKKWKPEEYMRWNLFIFSHIVFYSKYSQGQRTIQLKIPHNWKYILCVKTKKKKLLWYIVLARLNKLELMGKGMFNEINLIINTFGLSSS